jgi:two-component system sensor histidine kinase DegS
MMASNEPNTTSFEQQLEEWSQEYTQVQGELKEIDLLIQQTTAEVERLAQRNTQVTNRLRQVESALGTMPRDDIQEAYTNVLDTQQRLFTMRGQLEKLQSDQRNLARYFDLLRDMLSVTDYTWYGSQETEPEEEDEPAQPLVVRIIEAQERERQRLSRQMHDGPAQSLTNLILQAEICERLFDTDADLARAELTNLKGAVASTFQKVKGFILNLRPMMLDDLGLVPTLRRYVDSFSENNNVPAHITVTGKERRLASHKEVTIFRVVQELLNNAYEYSNATNIQINLDLGEETVRVAVEDNGSGFDPSELSGAADSDKLGLSMIRERIEMLGGQVTFDSSVGRGTRVSFEMPAS